MQAWHPHNITILSEAFNLGTGTFLDINTELKHSNGQSLRSTVYGHAEPESGGIRRQQFKI